MHPVIGTEERSYRDALRNGRQHKPLPAHQLVYQPIYRTDQTEADQLPLAHQTAYHPNHQTSHKPAQPVYQPIYRTDQTSAHKLHPAHQPVYHPNHQTAHKPAHQQVYHPDHQADPKPGRNLEKGVKESWEAQQEVDRIIEQLNAGDKNQQKKAIKDDNHHQKKSTVVGGMGDTDPLLKNGKREPDRSQYPEQGNVEHKKEPVDRRDSRHP